MTNSHNERLKARDKGEYKPLKQTEIVAGYVDQVNNALVITNITTQNEEQEALRMVKLTEEANNNAPVKWLDQYVASVDPYKEDGPMQFLKQVGDTTWYQEQEDKLRERFRQDSKDIMKQYLNIPKNERCFKRGSLSDDVPGINNTKFKVIINEDDFMTGFKQHPQTEVQEQSITTTKNMSKIKLGQKVLVYPEPGVEPILAIVTAIDELTGLIVEVTYKDADKKNKILKVKTKIVTVLPILYSFFKMIKSWFK